MAHTPEPKPEDKGKQDNPVALDKISLRRWEFPATKVVELITGYRPQRDQLGRLIARD